LLGWLQSGTRKGMLIGILFGGASFLVLGGLFGGMNRGPSGAVIGSLSGALGGVALGALIGAIWGTLRFPQEGLATVSIDLGKDGGRYAPGDRVDGAVEVTAQNTLRLNGGKVFFICRGFYAYDKVDESGTGQPQFVREPREYLLQQSNVVPAGVMRRGASQRYTFSFDVPRDALPTHHGYICAVRWSLHALLDVPDITPIEAHQEILVDAVAPVLQLAHGGYQSVTPSQTCQLALILPRVVYTEGEAVTARVHITPLESFRADEVRAVLVRVENTPSGDDHVVYVDGWDPESGLFHGARQPGGQGTTYVWLEGETNLSGPLTLEIAESVTFPFSIEIPTQWRPTLSTKDGRVNWKVGVVLSRAGHADVRAFHEIIVHTSSSELAEILEPDAGTRTAQAVAESVRQG
jgi:hypothetical protein